MVISVEVQRFLPCAILVGCNESSEELAAANYQPDDKEAHAAGEDIEMRNFLKDPCHLLTEMTLRDDRSHVTHHICIQVQSRG